MKLAFVNNTLAKLLLVLAGLTFTWIALFGLMHHMGGMTQDGVMSGCMFTGEVEVCTMNFSEHITLWQGVIRDLPKQLPLYLLLASLFTYFFFIKKRFREGPSLCGAILLRHYLADHPGIQFFHSLQEIFSRGILHPKIYA